MPSRSLRSLLAIACTITFASLLASIGSAPTASASARYPILTPAGVPPVNSVADSLFGFIFSNMTLTKASPGPVWHVIGDVFVQPGVILTIEPGVTVLFEANTDLLNSGDYFTKSELIVRGALTAQGTPSDSIRFVSTSSVSGSWGQIKFQPGSVGSLTYCRLSEATIGISSGTTSLTAYNCLVAHSGTGISTFGTAGSVTGLSMAQIPNAIVAGASTTTIEQCTLINHAIGSGTIISGTLSSLVVHNCTFIASGTNPSGIAVQADSLSIQDTNITLWGDAYGSFPLSASCRVVRASRCNIRGRYHSGLYLTPKVNATSLISTMDHLLVTGASTYGVRIVGYGGYQMGSFISLLYSTIDSCGTGVSIQFSSDFTPFPSPSVRNSIVTNSSTAALVVNNLNGSADYSNLWNVSTSQGVTLGSSIVSLNPLYLNSPPGDYHLRSISPCRTLGESGTELGRYGPNSGGSGVGQGSEPTTLALLPIYPNPLSGSGTISFNLFRDSDVAIDVFDSQGRVLTSTRSRFKAGLQSVKWEARSDSGQLLPSGVYFYRLTAAGASRVGRLTVVR